MKIKLLIACCLLSLHSIGQVNYDIKHLGLYNVYLSPGFLLMDSVYNRNFSYAVENYITKDEIIISPLKFNEYRVVVYSRFNSLISGSKVEVLDDFHIEKISDTDYLIRSNSTGEQFQRSKYNWKRQDDNDAAFATIYTTLEMLEPDKYYRQFSNYGCPEPMNCHEKAYMIVYKNGKMIYGIFSLGTLIIKRQEDMDLNKPPKKEVKYIYDNLMEFAEQRFY